MEVNLNNNSLMKLEGASNWNIWKFQTKVLLRGQGWLEVVEGRALKPEDPAEQISWENKDAKAQTMLVTRMTENVMLNVISCSTAAEMWRKLQSVYEQKTETNIHMIQQRFFQYKFEPGTEMSIFLSKIQELQNQLKQLGEEVSDKFVITKVLMSLPEEYKHFVSAWESAPDDRQTMDNLIARLLVEEERVKEKNEQPSSSGSTAFLVKDKKNLKCFKCNKLGHFISECRSNNNFVRSEGQNNKCFFCGKLGHSKSQCWFKKNKEQKKSNAFVVSNSLKEHCKSQWLVDTGASEHMCRDRELFSSFTSTKQESVIVGNGAAISVLGYGQMAVEVYDGSEWVHTTIDKVLFVPELKTNLFSVNCASDKGYVMLTDEQSCKFYKNNKICAIANRVGNSYYLELRYNYKAAYVAKNVKTTLQEWHERLAHQNFEYVRKILLKNNIDVEQSSVIKCESCLEGKMHRLPFGNSESVTTKTCELIHADTCGPMEVTSVGGSKYFVILKDDFSNYRTVYFVKNKFEIKNCIEDFVNKAENVTGNKLKIFRSDNGLEFINKEVKELFTKHGIIHQTSVPYTPEQNGKVERENRTLVEAARTMLNACKDLPKSLWGEAVNTAAFVLNRTGRSKDSEKSPYEVWSGKSFDIHQLKPFGTPVYSHIPKEKRQKWDSKGEKGVLVGYGETVKGFRIYFPQKNNVEIKRDIVFLQNEEKVEVELNYTQENENGASELHKKPIVTTSADLDETMEPASMSEESGTEYNSGEDSDSSLESVVEVREREPSKRVRKPPVYYQCQNVHTQQNEPVTYAEAMKRSDSSKWMEAIDKEMQTLEENNTWEICEVPENQKVVSSKWVFKIKRDSQNLPQYKARLVARGFEQDDILDLNDCYAPVVKLSTVRLFIIIATGLNLPISQMDVTGAFLYGNINENVYISLPEGAYSGKNNVVKLNKSLYGLKNSPKCWNVKFNTVMLNEGFVRSKCDSCLYTKCTEKDQIYLLLYVDDVLIFGSNDGLVEQVKIVLNKEFKMKDLGFVTDYLGINIKQNLNTGVTELSQRKYLESVLKRFGMDDCKPMSTPIDQNINVKLFQNDNTVDKNIEKLCRQMIGCLMYAVSGTRPDLCFTVSLLSRYQKYANNMLLSALKRVLRYVKHTLDYKLVYKCNNNILEGYCDADWGGDLTDRRSTTGYLFKFSDCLISWCSKKQVSVSLSSTESEYVALSMAASEACWLVNLLNDFNIKNVCPVPIYCDNQSAISVACTDSVKRLKHVDIRYHFIKELLKNNKLCLKYVKTSNQPADMLTKSLNRELITRFLGKCSVGNIKEM